MVYIIKQRAGLINEIDQLCKIMINIENNKKIYTSEGKENEIDISETPFNNYTYKQVEYNISVSMGVVVVYTLDDINFTTISYNMKNKFIELSKDAENSLPYSTYQYTSTYHTVVTRIPEETGTSISTRGKSYRKIIEYPNDIQLCCDNGSRFVWYLHIINNNNGKPYLQIPELSKRIPEKQYLLRAVSTIIYDGMNLLNINNGTRQINYPSVKQYTMFKKKQIVETPIVINQIYGLDFEIIKYYSDNNVKIDSDLFRLRDDCNEYDLIDYATVKLRRVNISKKWYIQLNDPFDYDKQEELESNSEEIGKPLFPNDVCFITGAPIYNSCYILKVGKKYTTESQDKKYTNTTHIMVSSYMYHNNIIVSKTKKKTFQEYFENTSGYTIIKTFISKYPRTELEAINLIPANKITDIKRNILQCISVNGGTLIASNFYYSNVFYTLNITKNIIYVGVSDMNDIDVIKYNMPNTILFQCKVTTNTYF
jgi:hypothetical protein